VDSNRLLRLVTYADIQRKQIRNHKLGTGECCSVYLFNDSVSIAQIVCTVNEKLRD
jgi:hypothetical protein